MIVKNRIEYATCRWNHCDSSRGSHRTFGRSHLSTFLHIGKTINIPSTERANPAPRESHTENVRVLRPANRESEICLYLRTINITTLLGHREDVPAKDKKKYMKTMKQDHECYHAPCQLSTEPALLSNGHLAGDVG